MSFSYDSTLSTPLDRIRFEIQDTDEDVADFSNEEIEAAYASSGSKHYKTSRNLLRKLWMKYAKAPSKVEVDGVRMDNPKAGEVYKELYKELGKLEAKETLDIATKGAIYFGGVERVSFNSNREDGSLVNPRFTQQQVDFSKRHPETTPLDKDEIYERDLLDEF